MQILRINRKNKKPLSAYVLSGFIVILTVLVAACPMLTAPPAMYAPTLIEGSEQLTASWIDPTTWNWGENNAGNDITSYNLRYGEVGSGNWTEITSGITGVSHTITELTNGVNYAVQVRAVNAQGTGGWSASATATPTATLTVPTAPTAPALEAGTGQLIATWTAPTDTGGSAITGYELQYRTDDGDWTLIRSGITCANHSSEGAIEVCHFSFSSYSPYTIHSITADGANYQLQVRAINAQGAGEWSATAMLRFPFARQVPAGTAAVVIVPADIDNPIATELSISLTTVGASNITVVDGDITAVTPADTPNGVTPPTVDSSSGLITLTVAAETTAGTYVIYDNNATGADGRRFAEYFYVTVSPQTNAELKTAVNSGISTWGDTANLNYIITTAVTDMSDIFSGKTTFNGDISLWNTAAVTNMFQMFVSAEVFNGDISLWDVSSVTNISKMFFFATSFNGDISGWDVSSVTNMSVMFSYASVFNGDISGWNVSKVTNMQSMFDRANTFNADISAWEPAAVTNMISMFRNASAFNGDLEEWKDHWTLSGGKYTGTTTSMFTDSGLDVDTDPITAGKQPNFPSWY